MTFALRALLAFAITLLSAWCWVLYLRFSHERKAVKAALADCAIIGLGMVNIVGYVEDHRLAGPILAGAFVGTYLVVRRR